MKQFKFFASLAMVALAACTNDGLELQPTVQKPGQGRPEADFVISVNENLPQTRAEFGQGGDGTGYGWIFQPGDKIGAMLMDEWDGLGESITNFDITDYAQTNYPIIRDENGRWSAHQDLNALAGNYFFYFPYEPINNARGHFGFSVNPNQPQYNNDGELFAYQPVVDNQKYLAYDFVPVKPVDGEPTKVDLNFVPLFATPTFQFINKTAVDLIVHKVAIRTTIDKTAGIYNKNVNDLIATTMALVPFTAGFEDVRGQWTNKADNYDKERSLMWSNAIRYTDGVDAPEATENEEYVWPKRLNVECGDKLDTYKWDPAGRPFYPISKNYKDTYLQQATYEYVADYTGVTDKYIVKPFNKIQSLLVMPAGYYNVEAMEALVYVSPATAPEDNYVVRIPLLTENYVSDDVTAIAGHKYLAPGKITKFFAEFDAAGMQSYDITKFQITSSEDLKWIVEQAKDHTGDYNLVVNTSGSRVVLTKEIEEILNSIPQVHLFVNGNITIASDASSNAINKLHFTNDNVTTNLTVLNEQIATKDILNCCNITVKKGGAILNEKHCVKATGRINNSGKIITPELATNVFNNYVEATITVNSYAYSKDGVKRTLQINNENGAKLNAKQVIGNVKNAGEAEIEQILVNPLTNKGGNIDNSGTATVNVIYTKATNSGLLNINSSVNTLENTGTTNIKGAISNTATNSGTINVIDKTTFAKVDNAKTGTINVNDVLTEQTTLTNNGTINVTAEILVPGQGKVNNAGTINVEGKLKENVYSKGLINVIGDGIVIANCIPNEEAGIIDVTNANNKDAAHAAKSNSSDMYFRYTVNVETGEKLTAYELKPRISAENYTNNPIILVWDDKSPAKYEGGTKVVADANITDVIINRELLLNGNTGFEDAVNVAINKQVTVGNGAEVAGFNCGKATVTISSVLKVNNHGKLTGDAKYTGSGIIEMLGANSTMSWTKATGSNVKVNK